jgi:serine/threonine protein kinase
MTEKIIKEKYEFDDDPINIGEFGFIYIIKDKKVKTEYILKKLLKKKNDNNKNKKTFEEELEFLINVKGKNIINIIDYYNNDENEKEKFNYMILENMDGDLDEMLNMEKYSKGMPSELIKKIFSQFNFALKIMYNKNRIPKYLKLSNILYSYTNEKKTDFVIKYGDLSLSNTSGTEMYNAPEINDKSSSDKCILYSIGLILYKLKTGEYIFEGNDLLEILTNKKNNKIKSDTNDTMLNELIKKLVVTEPENRMKWEDYFEHPFFKEVDNNQTQNQNQARIIYLNYNFINNIKYKR